MNLRETLNKEIWENIAYLRDVLGVRFISRESQLQSQPQPQPQPQHQPKPQSDSPLNVSKTLMELETEVSVCERCRLSIGRKKAVCFPNFGSFGKHQRDAGFIMFFNEFFVRNVVSSDYIHDFN